MTKVSDYRLVSVLAECLTDLISEPVYDVIELETR